MAKRARSRSSSRGTACRCRASIASRETSSGSESDTSCSPETSSSTDFTADSESQANVNSGSDSQALLVNQPPQPTSQARTAKKAPGSPAAVMVCADVGTDGLATPPTAPESSHEETVGSPYAANDLQHPASLQTHYTRTESFPVFRTGNVLIQCNLVTPPKQWRLHSAILERHSAWFRRAMHIDTQNKHCFHSWLFFLLEEHEGEVALVLQQAKSRLYKRGGQSLTIELETAQDSQVVAIPTPPASISKSATSSETLQKDDETHTAAVDIYNQILCSFYSIPLCIRSGSIDNTLSFCEPLVKISHSLNCTPLISAQISTALHQHRQSLYTSISSDPARWLLLAILLENSAIYTEALIHIIGAHPCWPWPTKRHVLPDETMQLVVRKSAELDRLCMEVERELLLTIHIHKSGPVEPHQHSHFDTWFIVQTFRDTLARTFHALDNDRRAALKRGALFRKIRKGGEEYMSLGEMRRLIGRIMPSAVENLEEDLDMLKEVAKGIVEDVAKRVNW